jgi:hypothetical protein
MRMVVVSMKKLSKKMKDSGFDISNIDLDKAIQYYEKSQKIEEKRLSTTQTSS